MSLKSVAFAAAGLAIFATLDSAPVAAQPVNCTEMYNRMMALYGSAPQSPEYSQMAAAYTGSCVPGAAAASPPPSLSPAAGSPGSFNAPPDNSLPMRGAPTNTMPTESRERLPGGGGHR
jgi:hypothetical protein